jgi:hypothetical protein
MQNRQIAAGATAQAGHLRCRQLGFDIANLLSIVALKRQSLPRLRLRIRGDGTGGRRDQTDKKLSWRTSANIFSASGQTVKFSPARKQCRPAPAWRVTFRTCLIGARLPKLFY